MHIVQRPIFCALFNMPEALGFFVKKLRLIDNVKSCRFHANEVLSAEFSIMPHLSDFESLLAHGYKPVDNIGVVYGWTVAHGQKSIIGPAEKRYTILVGLNMSLHHREPSVTDDDIHAFVISKKRSRR